MRAALLRRRRAGGGFGYLAANGYTPDLVADFVRGRYAYAVPHAGGYRAQPCDFGDLFTFARSGNATMVGADGTLQWAPHNLLTYSEDFGNAVWSPVNSPTVALNDTSAPDGSNTADSLVSTVNGATYFRYTTGLSVSTQYTFSVFMKANGGAGYAFLRPLSADASEYSTFNLNDGTVGASGSGFDTTIVGVGDGWYLCSITATTLSSITNNLLDVGPCLGSGSRFAEIGDGIYIWGAHAYRSDLGGMASVPVEERGLSTSATYLPTTSAARYLPRRGHHVYDGSSWVNAGTLIESEARTNLVTYSAEFDNAAWSKSQLTVTADATTDPAGGSAADKLVESSATSQHYLSQSTSVTSGSEYTFTVYAQAGERDFIILSLGGQFAANECWFNLSTGAVGTNSGANIASIEDAGSGWYRCRITETATGTGIGLAYLKIASTDASNSYTGDGSSGIYVWGAQLE